MVDGSTALLGGAALLVGAEAAGVTDLTGGDEGGGGGPGGGGGVPPGLVSALDSAAGAAGTLPSFDLSVPGTSGTSADRIVEEVVREVPTADDVPTLDTDPLPYSGLRQFTRGEPGTGGNGLDTSTSESFDLQDLAGTGGVGTAIATAGEVGASTGSAVEGVVDTAADNPIGTAGVAAGVAAAPLTGGASIPAALAAAGVGGQAAADADVSVPDVSVPDLGSVPAFGPLVGGGSGGGSGGAGPTIGGVPAFGPAVTGDDGEVLSDVSVPDVSAPDVGNIVPTGGDGADPSTAPGRGPVDDSDGPERSEEKQERTKQEPADSKIDLIQSGSTVGL